jgi:hypothetical protein
MTIGDDPPPLDPLDPPALTAEEPWEPPGSFDERPELDESTHAPATPAWDEVEPEAPSRPTPADPADLLRRAAFDVAAVTPGLDEEGGDPSLWDDPASRRELRMLVGLGWIAGVTALLVVPYYATGGHGRWPTLFTTTFFATTVMICGMGALGIYGILATFRRRVFLWLVLGIVLSPLVYAVWAAVLLARIRRRDARRAAATAHLGGSP